jgi:hypothetical protein
MVERPKVLPGKGIGDFPKEGEALPVLVFSRFVFATDPGIEGGTAD